MSFSSVLHLLGRLCLLFGVLLLVPAAMSWMEGGRNDPVTEACLYSAAVSAALGIAMQVAFRRHVDELDFEEGFAIVALGWVVFTILGCLPYWLSGRVPSFVDAAFESISGLSTCGASILPDPAALGRPLLLWRAFTQLIGGLGVIVLSLAILPALGAGGNFLFLAETGAKESERLTPRIRDTSRILWSVYLGITVVSIVSFRFAGMDWFDAVCHAFATVATGGFGTRADSFASFPAAVVWTAVPLMVISGLNQALLYASVRGRPSALLGSAEARAWIMLLVASVAICTAVLWSTQGFEESSLRDVVFSVVTVSSTSGFASADFGIWPESLQFLLLLLMLIGACAGSTCGGSKVFRNLLWGKAAWRELLRLLRPTGVFVVRLEGRAISEAVVTRSVAFLVFYLGATCLGTLLMTLLGEGALESVSGMVTCLSTVGPGLGSVGPASNFAALTAASKVILIGAMLLGRLEYFALLVLFSPLAWRR